MPTELGVHSPRIERIRELQTPRGRREQGRYAIEGPTLIAEALRSGVTIRELYAVAQTLGAHPEAAALESAATPVFTLPPRLYARCSDLETPPGLLAVVDIPAGFEAIIP